MKYEIVKNGKRKLIRGSVTIKTNHQDFSEVVVKVRDILNEFYLKTVEWKRDNPHTDICIKEQVRMFPTMASDMPLCSSPRKSIVVSSNMDPFVPVDVQTWKKNFEATAMALAGEFDQKTVFFEYTEINIAVFEKSKEGDD